MLQLTFLIVCLFVCVHDPHVACKWLHVVLPYRTVSVPVVGYFAHPQMLKRLLQRTKPLTESIFMVSGSSDAPGLLYVLQVYFSNLAQPRSVHSVCCDINTYLSFCCQPVAEYSNDENSAGTWDIIYSMQRPILSNTKT